MTYWRLPAKAATQKPKKELSGFFAAICAGCLLALLYTASAQIEMVAIKEFTVQRDSGEFYDGEKVKLNVTREPVCAAESWTGQGIRGEGILQIHKDVEPMPVFVEPCMTAGPAVTLPNGRVLHLADSKG